MLTSNYKIAKPFKEVLYVSVSVGEKIIRYITSSFFKKIDSLTKTKPVDTK